MPLLNSRFSNFVFAFPRGFFFPEIEEKYEIFFKRHPMVFQNMTDYMNYTVQSVSWPAVQPETTEQEFYDVTKTYKGGKNAMRYFDRQFDVTFRTTEGFLNYWIMHDQLLKYWELGESHQMFLPDLNIKVLDHYGYLVITMLLENPVLSGISALEFSYATNIPEFKTFSCTFNYKRVSFRQELS